MAESLEREIEGLRALFRSERDPDGRAFVPLADAYRRNRDLDRALQLLSEGIERHPDFASAHVVSAWIHRDRGDRDNARAAWGRVLELDEENVEALRGLGTLLLESGAIDEARPYLEKARALDPDDPDAHGYLAGVESAPAPVAARPVATPAAATEWPPPAAATEWPPAPTEAPAGWEALDEDEAALELARSLHWPSADAAPPAVEEPPIAEEAESVEPVGMAVGELPTQDTEEPPSPWVGALERAVEEAAEPDAFAEEAEDVGLREENVVAAAGTEALIRATELTEVWNERLRDDDEGEEPAALPATRTMAELFARQGLHARAAGIYERLVEERPDDAGLRARLAELRATLRPEPAEAPPAFTRTQDEDDEEDIAHVLGSEDDEPVASLFGWTPQESNIDEMEKVGDPISSYFHRLLGWEPAPGPGPGEAEGTGISAVAEPKVEEPALAHAADRIVVPIESLAPDRSAGLGPAPSRVVPIASLAPDAVPIESLAPDDEPPHHGSTIQF